MTTYTQGTVLSDVLLYEQPEYMSRGTAELSKGTATKIGTVLGMITKTKKYTPLNLTATDGSQKACAVAIQNVDATSADASIVTMAQIGVVHGKNLLWPEGATPEQIAMATDQLAERFIQLRN